MSENENKFIKSFQGTKNSIQFFYNIFKKKVKSRFNHFLVLLRASFTHSFQEQEQKRERHAKNLHALLPQNERFNYSILLIYDQPIETHFFESLESILNQSAPYLEVIIGFTSQPKHGILETIEKFQKKFSTKLRYIAAPKNSTKTSIFNLLAKEAKGNYLIFTDQDGKMRPDLLLRFEQTLRLLTEPEMTLLYSDEYKIVKPDKWVQGHPLSKLDSFNFPYYCTTFIPGAFLISAKSWNSVEGLRDICNGAHFYDLMLRLDLAGVKFCKIPIPLYARRKTYQLEGEKAPLMAIRALQDYANKKNLHWNITTGSLPGTLRAIPVLNQVPSIQAVIPFKNQKSLTLAAVHSLKEQIGVNLKITAVDNRSDDLSIAEELMKMDVEVLKIDEPFNFSRLNNLAIEQSKYKEDCDLLFFMNNDVELEKDALLEMCRWIYQPKIGMVGCRLNYPTGKLQCGGVDAIPTDTAFRLSWVHTECGKPFENLTIQRILRVVTGVHGAALLIKRETFKQIDGFEEIWYPVSYSDTNLSIKINSLGLLAFYTPFALGIHHESISRERDITIEDYEGTSWLNEKYLSYWGLRKSTLAKDNYQ